MQKVFNLQWCDVNWRNCSEKEQMLAEKQKEKENIILLCVTVWWIFIKSPFRKLQSRLKNITYEFLSDIDCFGTSWTAWAEINVLHAERDMNIKGQVQPKNENNNHNLLNVSHWRETRGSLVVHRTFLELQGNTAS